MIFFIFFKKLYSNDLVWNVFWFYRLRLDVEIVIQNKVGSLRFNSQTVGRTDNQCACKTHGQVKSFIAGREIGQKKVQSHDSTQLPKSKFKSKDLSRS